MNNSSIFLYNSPKKIIFVKHKFLPDIGTSVVYGLRKVNY